MGEGRGGGGCAEGAEERRRRRTRIGRVSKGENLRGECSGAKRPIDNRRPPPPPHAYAPWNNADEFTRHQYYLPHARQSRTRLCVYRSACRGKRKGGKEGGIGCKRHDRSISAARRYRDATRRDWPDSRIEFAPSVLSASRLTAILIFF